MADLNSDVGGCVVLKEALIIVTSLVVALFSCDGYNSGDGSKW
jgi:hypothetical protein